MKKNYILIAIGSLFILATLSSMLGSNILETTFNSTIEGKDFNSLKTTFGIMLEFVNIFSVIVISVLFQRILKKYHSSLSIVYLVSRVLEGLSLLVSVLSIFPLVFGNASANPTELFKLYNNWFQIGMLFLGIGSLFLLVLLKKEKILGNPLFILGVISYVALFASSVLELGNISSNFTLLLYLPGAIFEVAFPIWLIRKGVSKNESNSL